jgi:lipopolysaccharide/colanic/teichoic acid biosynthesis glycosyltransferase
MPSSIEADGMGKVTRPMLFKTVLADPVFSLFLGIFGLILLFPLMLVIAMIVGVSSDRPGAANRRFSVDDHPLHTVLLFNTRCRIGGFLKHLSLHALPVLLSMIEGQVTALELVEIDWRQVH